MSEPLRIRLRHGTPREQHMRTAVERLRTTYDLDALILTREIEIDERSTPHSHPVLTLDAAYEDPRLLLAEFVHEQLHWFEEAHVMQRDRAIERTRDLYPVVPSHPPDGAADETSTRLHLIVCYLEYRALERLVGDRVARETIEALSDHHYRWVYRTVLKDEALLAALIHDFDLLPEGLRATRACDIRPTAPRPNTPL